ncbi:hypothetical protein PIECOFPK_00925 [Mycovorax composti]|jgi:hypothetical protein|uniref:DUF4920 domain-containing protein n=2 Tax=Chitinophagaceae TaxID=563835 RepID=A0ABZ2EI95_9BACT
MKNIVTTVVLVLCGLLVQAQPPAGPANPGDTYGKKVTAERTLKAVDFNKLLSQKDTIDAKVVGKVLSSCPKKGCWMNVELDDKSTVFVRFKDYAFFVPTDIVGKTVVLDGIATQKEVSVAELKHYAQDAKKSQAEIDAITKPEKQVRFLADGVLVVK